MCSTRLSASLTSGATLLAGLLAAPAFSQAPDQPRLLYPSSFGANVNYKEINFQWEAPGAEAPPVEEWVILTGPQGTTLQEVARIADPGATSALVPVSLPPGRSCQVRLVAVNPEGETPGFTLSFTTAASIDPITVSLFPESVSENQVTYLAEVTENIDGAAPGGVALRLEWDPARLENVTVGTPSTSILTALPFQYQMPQPVGDNAYNVIGYAAENSRRRGVFMRVQADLLAPLDSEETPALTLAENPNVDDPVVSSGSTSARFPVEFENGNALPAPLVPRLAGATTVINDRLYTAEDGEVLPAGTNRPYLEFVAGGLGRSWDLYFWPDGHVRPSSPLTLPVTYEANRDVHRTRLNTSLNPTPGRWYRWQVVTHNSSGSVESPQWTFMVAEPTEPGEVADELLGRAPAKSDLNEDGVIDAADVVEAQQ